MTFVPGIGQTFYVPQVSLVGGTGNQIPLYNVNEGFETVVGNRVYVDVLLADNPGYSGDEGAGTGNLFISLNTPIGSSQPTLNYLAGRVVNGSNVYLAFVRLIPSSSTVQVLYQSAINTTSLLQGLGQNNETRSITLSFSYLMV